MTVNIFALMHLGERTRSAVWPRQTQYNQRKQQIISIFLVGARKAALVEAPPIDFEYPSVAQKAISIFCY